MDLVELFNDISLTYEEKILQACEYYELPTSNPDWMDNEKNFMTFYLLTYLNSNQRYNPEDLSEILKEPQTIKGEFKSNFFREEVESLVNQELDFSTIRQALPVLKENYFPLSLMVELTFKYNILTVQETSNTGFKMFILSHYQILNLEDYLQYNRMY